MTPAEWLRAERQFWDDIQTAFSGESKSEANLVSRVLATVITKAEAEGWMTKVQFQDLCHDLPESDYQAFCDGCDAYQRKLFGKCRSDEIAGTLTTDGSPWVGVEMPLDGPLREGENDGDTKTA